MDFLKFIWSKNSLTKYYVKFAITPVLSTCTLIQSLTSNCIDISRIFLTVSNTPEGIPRLFSLDLEGKTGSVLPSSIIPHSDNR